ncbi:30S ribosomal protein S8 [bacterium]|nr:MAG: 30S ribosomal protein S8 [bacterium]
MSVSDPIADMLTRIRNGIETRAQTVIIPASGLKKEVLKTMVAEGYLADIGEEEDGKQGLLIAYLKYDDNDNCVIDGLKRESKQGRRVYVKSEDIPKVRSGFGTVILTTSRGVMTDTQARKLGVGGEVICSIW